MPSSRIDTLHEIRQLRKHCRDLFIHLLGLGGSFARFGPSVTKPIYLLAQVYGRQLHPLFNNPNTLYFLPARLPLNRSGFNAKSPTGLRTKASTNSLLSSPKERCNGTRIPARLVRQRPIVCPQVYCVQRLL